MSHLADYTHRSSYTQAAFELMVVCPSVRYKVLEFIGEGGFGKVAKCVNMNTNENTAIKILKYVNDYAEEVEMLEKLRTLDPERNNLVRFMDSFIVDDKFCIAFECLDRSLLDLMVQREERLTLNEIRPITRQLLVALNALKGIGLLHADLKLDNVMLVNHQDEPFRVKLIDFGVALPASDIEEGMIAQPYAYRAPEVSLGLPISEAIDMWSLGSILKATRNHLTQERFSQTWTTPGLRNHTAWDPTVILQPHREPLHEKVLF
uniref:Protein kinase domain-containing protein n=1 Tax=Gasterosteus aculeatus aculeatus TaxID=481459 RepID=A0AAQ4PIE7_GASAC